MAVLRAWLICAFAGVLLLANAARAAEPKGLSEQELRAAALFQILHFTRWPAGTFQTPDEPLKVAILGEDPFGSLIDELVAGESTSGHPIQIERVFTAEAAEDCHVVYMSAANERVAARALHQLRDKTVLTVGDSDKFCESGGIIALTVRNNRIRILVNLEEARRANVTLSSKLLRLSQIMNR